MMASSVWLPHADPVVHTHLITPGLPFFTAFFIMATDPDPRRCRCPASARGDASEPVIAALQPLNGLENLAAGVSIETIIPGTPIALPGFEVVTAAVPHGSMWTTAYRITADNRTVTFLSDVEYPSIDEPLPAAIALAHEADLLIHDAMYADEDYERSKGWGHSPARAGVVLAERARAKKLALFHHSPDATDDMIDAVVERTAARTAIPVIAAAEGHYLDI
jgi:ribonuclease BN (tRNA processing enzyme)